MLGLGKGGAGWGLDGAGWSLDGFWMGFGLDGFGWDWMDLDGFGGGWMGLDGTVPLPRCVCAPNPSVDEFLMGYCRLPGRG